VRTPLLLSEWLPIWRERDLPHIDAEPVGSISVHDLLHWDEPLQETRDHLCALRGVARSAINAQDEPWERCLMLRWDCCAPEVLKHIMSKPGGAQALGGGNDDDRWAIYATGLYDDYRLYDIVSRYIAPAYGIDHQLILYARPIVRGHSEGGYPVEFRVFVQDHAVVGVSSYYPQRPLESLLWVWAARQVAGATLHLVDVCPSFTADFLCAEEATEDMPEGWILIECGPPHIADPRGHPSAHPCCFPPGRVRGIALSPMEGAISG